MAGALLIVLILIAAMFSAVYASTISADSVHYDAATRSVVIVIPLALVALALLLAFALGYSVVKRRR